MSWIDPDPMTTVLLSLLLAAAGASTGAAQPEPPTAPDRDVAAVRATLDALFDGMRAGDSAAVRAVFDAEARGVQALDQTGEATTLRTQSVDDFVAAVGQPRERMWDERVWDVDVRVDGDLATAWMSYVFYVGDERSHCGVNSMHLARRAGKWWILHIAYTRRTECDVPADVRRE